MCHEGMGAERGTCGERKREIAEGEGAGCDGRYTPQPSYCAQVALPLLSSQPLAPLPRHAPGQPLQPDAQPQGQGVPGIGKQDTSHTHTTHHTPHITHHTTTPHTTHHTPHHTTHHTPHIPGTSECRPQEAGQRPSDLSAKQTNQGCMGDTRLSITCKQQRRNPELPVTQPTKLHSAMTQGHSPLP
jgi:hypothetical protein